MCPFPIWCLRQGTLCKAILCPTVILRICMCGKENLIDLKLNFGYMVQWQQIHHTVEGQRTTAFHCKMSLLPLDYMYVSKNQLSTNLNSLNAHGSLRNSRWIYFIPLDMYHLALYARCGIPVYHFLIIAFLSTFLSKCVFRRRIAWFDVNS